MRIRAMGLAVLVCLVWMAAAWPALAALPDWAEPIADAAPSLPEGLSEDRSRLLFSELRYEVQPDGKCKIRRRLALQALTTTADEEVGVGIFSFAGTTKVKSTKAWHVPPDKRGRKSRDYHPLDVTMQDSFLSDSKVRAKHVPGVKKGSLVFFEFEAIDEPYFLMLSHFFYEGIKTDVIRYQLRLPPGWEHQAIWLRRQGPEPLVQDDTITWEMRDLPAPDHEPLAPDPFNESPLLAIHLVPPAELDASPEIFSDWDAFSRWFQELSRGRADLTPAVRREAETALAGVDEEFAARVEAVGQHVRDKIRYLAVELGIGGYQPRSASETLENLYGDCKDKGTLFRAMLSAYAIPSFPVLVNLGMEETVLEEYPFGLFDHLVVAVPVPPDVEMPERFGPALVDAGTLGKLLIVDTTSEMTAIGSLPASLAGKRALVIADGGDGAVITLPVDPDAHSIHRLIEIDVSDSGLSGRRQSTYTGEFAAWSRADYRRSSVDRLRSLERRLVSLWPDARITDNRVEPEDPVGAFIDEIAFERSASAVTGNLPFVPFEGAEDEIPRVSLKDREVAIDYGHPMMVRYDVMYRGVRETATPASRAVEGDGWSVRTDYESTEGTLSASLEIRVERARFDPDRFSELRKLWGVVSSATRTALALEPIAGSDAAAGH